MYSYCLKIGKIFRECDLENILLLLALSVIKRKNKIIKIKAPRRKVSVIKTLVHENFVFCLRRAKLIFGESVAPLKCNRFSRRDGSEFPILQNIPSSRSRPRPFRTVEWRITFEFLNSRVFL